MRGSLPRGVTDPTSAPKAVAVAAARAGRQQRLGGLILNPKPA